MARGWESKSIESQQDDAERRKAPGPALSASEQAKSRQRATLELTRARLADDLRLATAIPHRRMLEHALAEISAQLELLS